MNPLDEDMTSIVRYRLDKAEEDNTIRKVNRKKKSAKQHYHKEYVTTERFVQSNGDIAQRRSLTER